MYQQHQMNNDMTQKDKELLLKDLCARLPYNVAIQCKSDDIKYVCYIHTDIIKEIEYNKCHYDYKPYLFPISSMTKEQIKEFNSITQRCNTYTGKAILLTDFCNKHHIDIRGLINIGLAIDATGLKIY